MLFHCSKPLAFMNIDCPVSEQIRVDLALKHEIPVETPKMNTKDKDHWSNRFYNDLPRSNFGPVPPLVLLYVEVLRLKQ